MAMNSEMAPLTAFNYVEVFTELLHLLQGSMQWTEQSYRR